MERLKLRFAETAKPEWVLVTRDYAWNEFIPLFHKEEKRIDEG